jgi:hypothetical protein
LGKKKALARQCSGFGTVAGQGRARFGHDGADRFGKFRTGFRRLVPMNMDSGLSPE